MSSTVETKSASIQQRTSEASRALCAALGLVGVSATNMKYLTLAIAEVADEEANKNPDFAARLRSRYESLLPPTPARVGSSTSAARTRKTSAPLRTHLTPIGTVDERLLDPNAPPNPFVLQKLYGNEQLAAALERHSPAELREAVVMVQERYPGSKPQKLTKAGIIGYIVDQLAGSAS